MEVMIKQSYKCEICGAVSSVEERVVKCEASHIKIDETAPVEAQYQKTEPKISPLSLIVPMMDGSLVKYTRHSLVQKPPSPEERGV